MVQLQGNLFMQTFGFVSILTEHKFAQEDQWMRCGQASEAAWHIHNQNVSPLPSPKEHILTLKSLAMEKPVDAVMDLNSHRENGASRNLCRVDLIGPGVFDKKRQGEMEKESTKIHQILSMKGGLGDESYAKNSKPQRAILSSSVPVLAQAVLDFCDTKLPHCITIADLGCSSGPNTLFAVTRITSLIYERFSQLGQALPEFSIFLNDLPGNDFNAVFQTFLPAFKEKKWAENGSYISGVPGSFYGRLFPSNSLHFVHSGTSLHWLSQVPPELNDKSNPLINKGKIYISKTSPEAAIAAYQNQFQKDFFSFLMARSKEVVPGGRMVFTLNARRIADPTADESCLIWDYLGQALQDLVLKGLMEEEKLDTYNVPYYEPYVEEIKTEIAKEGSFTVNCLEIIALPWDACNGGMKCDRATTAKNWVRVLRAINEPMVRSHFGAEVLDPFFQSLTGIIAADTKEVEHVSAVVYVTRKD